MIVSAQPVIQGLLYHTLRVRAPYSESNLPYNRSICDQGGHQPLLLPLVLVLGILGQLYAVGPAPYPAARLLSLI